MVASMKASQIRLVVSGSLNPRVVRDEPLISNAFCQIRLPVPQKISVKATTMRIIQASGKVTNATGAYNRRSRWVRSSLLQRGTSNR